MFKKKYYCLPERRRNNHGKQGKPTQIDIMSRRGLEYVLDEKRVEFCDLPENN